MTDYWEDTEFPACDETLGVGYGCAQWLRPHQLPGAKNPQLFKSGANKNDVAQGAIGNCYLIAVITEHPDIMNKIFVSTEEDHAVGRYTARLWVQGGWKNVTVDDRIPCADDGLPCFASCADIDECWVPILEKVFAKHFGSYSNLEAANLYKISYH